VWVVYATRSPCFGTAGQNSGLDVLMGCRMLRRFGLWTAGLALRLRWFLLPYGSYHALVTSTYFSPGTHSIWFRLDLVPFIWFTPTTSYFHMAWFISWHCYFHIVYWFLQYGSNHLLIPSLWFSPSTGLVNPFHAPWFLAQGSYPAMVYFHTLHTMLKVHIMVWLLALVQCMVWFFLHGSYHQPCSSPWILDQVPFVVLVLSMVRVMQSALRSGLVLRLYFNA